MGQSVEGNLASNKGFVPRTFRNRLLIF